MRMVFSINRKIAAALLMAIVAAPLESAHALTSVAVRGKVGGINYAVPKRYRASASEGGLYVEASLPDLEPWRRKQPGWDDHLQILVTESLGESMSMLWGRLYDGTPRVPGKPYTIVSTRRVEPNLTVLRMESGDDVYLPDQEKLNLLEGFLVCAQPKPPIFPHASCKYFFNEGAQRWQITFGRKFLHNFKGIRTRAKEFIHRFEER